MIRIMLSVAMLFSLSCCASLPERPQETARTPPRIIEEDITGETSRYTPSSSGVETSGPAVIPSPQESQELGASGNAGPKPPRRIIWRDQGTKDRKQQ